MLQHQKLTVQHHQMLRPLRKVNVGATGLTPQHRQMLRLPRRMTLMIDHPHI